MNKQSFWARRVTSWKNDNFYILQGRWGLLKWTVLDLSVCLTILSKLNFLCLSSYWNGILNFLSGVSCFVRLFWQSKCSEVFGAMWLLLMELINAFLMLDCCFNMLSKRRILLENITERKSAHAHSQRMFKGQYFQVRLRLWHLNHKKSIATLVMYLFWTSKNSSSVLCGRLVWLAGSTYAFSLAAENYWILSSNITQQQYTTCIFSRLLGTVGCSPFFACYNILDPKSRTGQ